MAIRYPHGTLSLGCSSPCCARMRQDQSPPRFGAIGGRLRVSGGGTHIYLVGQNLGSAFAAAIYLGQKLQAECKPQPFTSSKNRIHCIVAANALPAPEPAYYATGKFVELPLKAYKNGRPAACWQQGTINHNCMVRFDVGGTPRVRRVLTQLVESGSTLRLSGEGIDGGMRGAQRLAATLYRGATPVLGACGEKDCQASNMGAETIGCYSRPDAGGDGVSGMTQDAQVAVVLRQHALGAPSMPSTAA